MTIGIVGGMGSWATVDFFRRIIAAFPAQKEWERPRVLIDNYCTMPSRVRAILYDEKKKELIEDLSASVQNLIRAGADRIVLACNTSHAFLADVQKNVPESRGLMIDLIRECALHTSGKGQNVFLIASEGTIAAGIYQNIFDEYGIPIENPTEDDQVQIRDFIEAVKQDQIDDAVLRKFVQFLDGGRCETVILGCTEIPVLHSMCVNRGYQSQKTVIDPLQCVIDRLVKERAESAPV